MSAPNQQLSAKAGQLQFIEHALRRQHTSSRHAKSRLRFQEGDLRRHPLRTQREFGIQFRPRSGELVGWLMTIASINDLWC
jgi:hypothetical protein